MKKVKIKPKKARIVRTSDLRTAMITFSCENCNAEIDCSFKFCPYCGAKFESSTRVNIDFDGLIDMAKKEVVK